MDAYPETQNILKRQAWRGEDTRHPEPSGYEEASSARDLVAPGKASEAWRNMNGKREHEEGTSDNQSLWHKNQ